MLSPGCAKINFAFLAVQCKSCTTRPILKIKKPELDAWPFRKFLFPVFRAASQFHGIFIFKNIQSDH